jgi:hypothetical protein
VFSELGSTIIFLLVIAFLLAEVWWLSIKCERNWWRGYRDGQVDHELGIDMRKRRGNNSELS